ncbi:MAG: FG-GAP repeat domain-containing protein [Thermoanaerobaculia bacterium]
MPKTITLGLCILALAEAQAPPAPPFRAPTAIALGSGRRPSALAAGDFDRDGRKDLAVVSEGTDDLQVLLGDGRGGFRRGNATAAGANPAEICAGDFDRDGRVDLAVANHETSSVTVLRGDGRGGFRPAPGSPVAVASLPHPHTIDTADLDGDGILDLLIDSWQENRLKLLSGDGRGGFRGPGRPVEAGRKPYRNLILADLDGDGRSDIATPSTAGRGVTLLFGDGRGSFRGAASPPVPAGPSPFVVKSADLDRDGAPDLVVANYSGRLSDSSGDALTFLLGDGRGGFRLGARLSSGRAPLDIAAGDVNGDGYADAVTANAGSRDLTVALGGPDGLSPSRLFTVPLGRKAERVLLEDFDSDGKADAVTANHDDGDLSVLLAR